MPNLPLRGNNKRRSFFSVKWAICFKISSHFFQRNKFLKKSYYVYFLFYLFYLVHITVAIVTYSSITSCISISAFVQSLCLMAVTVILGSQWGDEGKGKIIDFLSPNTDYGIRFHGGNNAGHTVINEFCRFPLHLVPSGIFAKKAKACISSGTVLDLEVLVNEIEMLKKAKIPLTNRLFISPRCHIIMPYHKILDVLIEEAKGKGKTGTTGRGIGPVYADKVSYNGIRLIDLFESKQFSQKLSVQLSLKNKIIKSLGGTPLKQKDVEEKLKQYFKKLRPYIKEPYPMLHNALNLKKSLLFEGAQGMFLDNDWGTYPFVTASTVLVRGINAGTGIH